MCVDLDLKSDTEEPELENEGNDKSGNQGNVLKVLEEEMDRVKERGGDALAWLELEEMGIDDEMLRSLDLSTKFPVRSTFINSVVLVSMIFFTFFCIFQFLSLKVSTCGPH